VSEENTPQQPVRVGKRQENPPRIGCGKSGKIIDAVRQEDGCFV